MKLDDLKSKVKVEALVGLVFLVAVVAIGVSFFVGSAVNDTPVNLTTSVPPAQPQNTTEDSAPGSSNGDYGLGSYAYSPGYSYYPAHPGGSTQNNDILDLDDFEIIPIDDIDDILDDLDDQQDNETGDEYPEAIEEILDPDDVEQSEDDGFPDDDFPEENPDNQTDDEDDTNDDNQDDTGDEVDEDDVEEPNPVEDQEDFPEEVPDDVPSDEELEDWING